MLPDERDVAGLRCSEVLERLSALVDGELSPDHEAGLRAHVAGCDVCERFGGEFVALVQALRARPDDDVEPDVAARLTARLAARR